MTLVLRTRPWGTPIVASVVFARVLGRDASLEEAARDLGARPLRVLLTVTLPLALPAILSGWLLAMTLSFDDVVTSSFLAGPERPRLPMAIFSSLRVGVNPEINAIGTLMLAGVATIFTVAFLRGEPRQSCEGQALADLMFSATRSCAVCLFVEVRIEDANLGDARNR